MYINATMPPEIVRPERIRAGRIDWIVVRDKPVAAPGSVCWHIQPLLLRVSEYCTELL